MAIIRLSQSFSRASVKNGSKLYADQSYGQWR